jgi:hypothetical protein
MRSTTSPPKAPARTATEYKSVMVSVTVHKRLRLAAAKSDLKMCDVLDRALELWEQHRGPGGA